jgi:hypothetical protein
MTSAEYYIPSSKSAPQQPQPPIALAMDHYISKLANVAKIDTEVERLAIDIAHKTTIPTCSRMARRQMASLLPTTFILPLMVLLGFKGYIL